MAFMKRYVFPALAGATAYVLLGLLWFDGPIEDRIDPTQLLLVIGIPLLLVGQMQRRFPSGRTLVIFGGIMFAILWRGMWYLSAPIDSFDALWPLLFVMMFPTVLIGIGLHMWYRERQLVAKGDPAP